MADGGQKSNTGRKSRKRSKSLGSKSRAPELVYSVSREEKEGIVRRKSRKQLEEENIVIDVVRHEIEDQLRNAKTEIEKLKNENDYLKSQLEKSDVEKAEKGEKMQNLEQEIVKLKTDFDAEKAAFRTEKTGLALKLEKAKQERNKLKNDFDKERTELEKEKRKPMEDLTKERTEHWNFTQHLSKLFDDSRAKVYVTGACKNIQVGDSNIVKQDLMSNWEELTNKLCLSVEESMFKRRELEMDARRNEVLLKEIQDSLNKVLKNLDKTTSKRLGQDKDLLEFLTSDRSDERIITDGIKQLKKHFAGSKSGKNLPLVAEAAIARLLNKFDGHTCRTFIEMLEGNKQKSGRQEGVDQTQRKKIYVDTTEFIQLQQSDNDSPLNRRLCVDILGQWLKLSEENDEDQLLGRIKVYESKLSIEMVMGYQEEIRNRSISTDPDKVQILQECEGLREHIHTPDNIQHRTQNLQGLPDALTQFMHQLEGLKTVLIIDRKVDQITDILKAMGAAENRFQQERNCSEGKEQQGRTVSISDV